MRTLISRLIIIAVIVGVCLFLLQRAGQFSQTISAIAQAQFLLLIPALIATVAYIAVQARILHTSFKLTGTKIPYREALRLWLGSHFVNAMVPSGFFSGMAYLVLKGKTWQKRKSALVIGVVLSVFAAYIAILIVFFGGALVHVVNPQQNRAVTIAAQTLAIIVGLLIIFSILLVEYFPLLIALARRFRRFIGKILSLDRDRFDVVNPVEQVNSILTTLHKNWFTIIEPIGDGLITHVLGMGILLSAFWSLGFAISPIAVVTGYVVGALLTIVSITPDGLGFVEVATPLVFVGMGVPLPIATAAVLIWRIFTFWLILGLGGIAFRSVEKVSADTAKPAVPAE